MCLFNTNIFKSVFFNIKRFCEINKVLKNLISIPTTERPPPRKQIEKLTLTTKWCILSAF